MSLGLESGTVRVVPYDASWPRLFALEAERLHRHFDERNLAIVIEHTGSTAVPGLAAKPILDILAGYAESASRETYIAALVEAGYVFRGEQGIPGRDFFRKGDPRAYHVHLTTIDSKFWRDHLTFRNALRAEQSLRDAYGALKAALADQFPRDRESYIEGKGSFVEEVIGRFRSR